MHRSPALHGATITAALPGGLLIGSSCYEITREGFVSTDGQLLQQSSWQFCTMATSYTPYPLQRASGVPLINQCASITFSQKAQLHPTLTSLSDVLPLISQAQLFFG